MGCILRPGMNAECRWPPEFLAGLIVAASASGRSLHGFDQSTMPLGSDARCALANIAAGQFPLACSLLPADWLSREPAS